MATEPSTTKQSENEEEAISLKFDVVGRLPLEIAQKILFQLSPDDLYSSTSCCLSWKAALSCDFFWERLCQREGYFVVEELKRTEFHTNFLKRYNYWQGVFWYNYTVQRNWEINNYSEISYEFDNPSTKWLFDDAFVYTTENNTKLKVHYFNSNELKVYVFPLHHRFKRILSKSGKYLISFMSSCFTVWNLENGSTIHRKHPAHNFYDYKNFIVFSTIFGNINVFNMETEEFEYCFPIEFGKVAQMSFMDGRIIFIRRDTVINILKWDDKSLVTLTCCDESEISRNHKIMVKNDILLSFCKRHRGDGVYNTFLCVWNITTVTKLHSTLLDYSIDQHSVSFINKCIYFRNYCYQGGGLYDIVLWDYMKRTEEATLKSLHELESLIPNIVKSNDHVMIVPDSPILKMWCLSKKDFIYDLNFIPHDCIYCNVVITETKLTYAILLKESNHIKLYVRNFEI